MARPTKQWLDYFSMDVEKDNKLKFVKAKFWLIWFATYIELLQFVYKEWYYVEFNDDNMLLFMSETWLKEEETKLMLEFMLEKWLFIKDLYNKYKVLTSSWIQKRYAEWTKKRKNTSVYKGFWVAWDYDHIELMDTLTWLKEEETELKEEESTQRKGKERKGKETKTLIPPLLDDVISYFTENWYMESIARKAFMSYNSANRHDSKWNKVINRKQKMVNVWFKDENKIKQTSIWLSMNDKLKQQQEETERIFNSYQNK